MNYILLMKDMTDLKCVVSNKMKYVKYN